MEEKDMLKRLTSFAERSPKSAAKVILSIAIALCVIIFGILIAVIGIENPFDEPYPDEPTPLSWTEGLMTWTSVNTVVFISGGGYSTSETMDPSDHYEMDDGWGRNYSCMRFRWDYSDGSLGGHVANESEQQELSAGVEITVESPIMRTWGEDGEEIRYSLVVTDLQGNGAFDKGDRIALKKSPGTGMYGDDVYTIALVCLCPTELKVGEYSFAFHDGELYSWESSELDWHQPWWEW